MHNDDPCDNQPTVTIDGRLFLVLHWGTDMAREPVNDPHDDWLTGHDRRWMPVNDPRNRHARRSDPDGFYRQIVGRGLRPVPTFDERDEPREWSLERFRETSDIMVNDQPINFVGVTDRSKAYRQAQQRFIDDLYGQEPRGPGSFFDPANLPNEAAQLSGQCDHHWIEGAEGTFAGLTEHCSHCGLER